MKLILIRHAESEHNVAQVYAGTTDSALTNHGMLQIQRLALHFKAQGVAFNTVFSSDLLRARTTAEGICGLSSGGEQDGESYALQPIILPLLREKDFGALEGKSWLATREGGADFVSGIAGEPESLASVASRVDSFLSCHLLPVLRDAGHTAQAVAIVSHGILLSALWEALSQLFLSKHVVLAPGVKAAKRISQWSNTGYLELAIGKLDEALSTPAPTKEGDRAQENMENRSARNPPLHDYAITVLTINGRHHLSNLRRTPGVGSSKHDAKQLQIDNFFQKPKN
ncbi:phosphoglycerate mutase [Histoplasma capsulatum G186AR]|uniref:Phosphoglycerate mutase n=2 Tax=Ajellomyces capsulatus TaxID=5037 RepID=C0NDF2_AJECG|nr:phosphoglycerate mutase [Histoplasma capsulatum G186AR]EEH11693.1 phosphoglycerate mutase [Histoplasma capsulatum G186AR]